METKKVLVVDDSQLQLTYAKGLLEKAGYQVLTSNHMWVLTLVLKEKPDLILMDVEMDGFVGTDSVKALKNTKSKETPILLYSGKEEAELEKLSRECGADGYVRKSKSGLKCKLVEMVNAILKDEQIYAT